MFAGGNELLGNSNSLSPAHFIDNLAVGMIGHQKKEVMKARSTNHRFQKNIA